MMRCMRQAQLGNAFATHHHHIYKRMTILPETARCIGETLP